MTSKGSGGFFSSLGAVALGALLFAASFPNPLFQEGLPLLAWIAYTPVFWVIRRASLSASVFWGALYAYGSYCLFNYWLGFFHPLAGFLVYTLYMVYMAALFPLLKLALLLFPRRGFLVQWLIWLAYEYLRTLGFLGYSYGVTGYSQWKLLPVIQIAALFGVWGVSALVLFPSVYLAGALESLKSGGVRGLRDFFYRERIPVFAWGAALVLTLAYGFVSQGDYSQVPAVKIALIQNNADPWKGGAETYRRNSETLIDLSRRALEEEGAADLVVWPETAFIPRIYWHLIYRDEPEYYPLVRDLMNFLKTQTVPYLIGNDDGRKEVSPDGTWEKADYNAALLFQGEELVSLYRKLKLVPFTEYFPYKKRFPRIYRALTSGDNVHLWKPGNEAVLFEISRGGESWKFAAPICFEDTFGYLSRDFTRRGADIIVNISNDAWSGSLSAQTQHLAMAVFRAVENRRSLVRAASSGQTCAVDPNGRILAMAEPFKAVYLNVRAPLVKGNTPYTALGDYMGIFFTAATAAVLFIGIILRYNRGQSK